VADESAVYYRVHALQESLGVQDGDELHLADCMDIASRRHGDPLPRHLREFLHEWATVAVPRRWDEYTKTHHDGGPWLDPNDLNAFTRYLRDYLVTEDVFEELLRRLSPVVNLKTRDEAARRRARRQYTRIIMNDYVMNPGPSMTPIRSPQKTEEGDGGDGESTEAPREEPSREDYRRFGLMAGFIQRWAERLPQALAQGAGEHVQIPPGNPELIEILEPYEK